MPRPFTPKIITANDLLEGDVIYFTDTNGWSRELQEAELIEDEAEAQLRLLEAEKDALHVVGIYLTDAKSGDNGPEPTHFREDFRRTGPSNYRHGKQEAAANV
ncbi:hypothetical protein MACH17_13910 [Phaeobacter inhibens]|uniref:DUF2849 domain-containing protein n=1 Tax=Phaeobacter inhibens TaxID=221822 RepID=UPI000C9AB025|nr:DUF2849 domain-containing protein [Phaeobacter inhibens]AUR04067.1 hypothetical protein PhaeoP72_02105 [Phaeobacter inhibens]GLO69874.1 hypothetical protein MACH17_13910 [Phaeobacter inhibens]